MIALFASLYAAAEHYGVLEELKEHFTRRGQSVLTIEMQILRAAPKAWRWVPEMREIADTLETAGMPGEFHFGAAKIYERLAGFKDVQDTSLEDVLKALKNG